MPTIPRLIAAVIFAATAYAAGEYYKLGMTEGVKYGLYSAINAFIGLLCGWLVMGKLTGKGYSAAVGSGLRTSVTITVWALLVFGTVLMVRKAFRKTYKSPLEAIVDIFALMLEHSVLLLSIPVLSALVLGGIVGGLASEWAKQRWE